MNRRTVYALVCSLSLCATTGSASTLPDERLLLDVPTAAGALIVTQRIDHDVHRPGTPGDYALALWTQREFQSFGFHVTIEPFTGRTSTPERLVLALLTSTKKPIGITLREGPIVGDPLGDRADAGLPYLDGSGDGNVTAPLIFANYGSAADFATLATRNINVRSKIVLIRDGRDPRGVLARRAQSEGVAGVVFYSDPANTGSGRGETYPDGPWQPNSVVRRGSLGYPDLHIPVLPISAANAQIFLADLRGLAAPKNWTGGLEAPYVLGMTEHPVHLEVKLRHYFTTMWNTVATLPGLHPTSNVLLGAHRDAWVTGATDDGAGLSILLEVGRALGYLHATGWQPRRSITILGFDGGDLGSLGSSWYVYNHQHELENGTIAYLNADTSTTGTQLDGDTVAALLPMSLSALRTIPDPVRSTSMLSQRPSVAVLAPPAGGTDFEPFLYTIGIPVAQFNFSGPFGVKNSAYDDLNYAERIADPQFANHHALAQLYAMLALRLADSVHALYSFSAYGPALRRGLIATTQGRGSLTVATRPIVYAISRFEQVAKSYDSNGRQTDERSKNAVHILDRLLYGRDGYRSIAFPTLEKALATGNHYVVEFTAQQIVRQLDAATAVLE